MTLDGLMAEAVDNGRMVLVLASLKNDPPVLLKQLAITLRCAAAAEAASASQSVLGRLRKSMS
jgi:hypothetical protein